MDLDGKPVQKPFKPFITQPRRRFKGGFDKGHNGHGRCFPPDQCGRFQANRGQFRPWRPFGKFDKSPNTKCPRVTGRPFNKDKIHCFECKEFGHIQDCLELNKSLKEDNPQAIRNLKTTPTPIQDLMSSLRCRSMQSIPTWPQPMIKPWA